METKVASPLCVWLSAQMLHYLPNRTTALSNGHKNTAYGCPWRSFKVLLTLSHCNSTMPQVFLANTFAVRTQVRIFLNPLGALHWVSSTVYGSNLLYRTPHLDSK
jgi:hypothetical protein